MRIPATAVRFGLKVGAIYVALFGGAILLLAHVHLHWVFSASIPEGFYRETPDGEYAGFCLPPPALQQAIAAGMETVTGPCPGHVAVVIKRFFEATPETPVEFSAEGFRFTFSESHWFVNNRSFNTEPKSFSRTGKLLTHYPFGTYTSGIWVISSYNRDSFDSRYFGPVDPTAIRFHATPVWTW